MLTEVVISNRRADAISIGTWRSRGQAIQGYELKTNRVDFLREYEDHQKCEPAMAICDHFWLVTNPGVCELHELPENWGLLLSNGRRGNLKVEKAAPKLRTDVTHPISREILVVLLRRIRALGLEEREAIFDEARKEAAASVDFDRRNLENRVENSEARVTELSDGWEAFHQALGLERWKWRPTQEDFAFLGKIAAAMQDGEAGLERLRQDLRRMEDTGGDLVGKLNDAIGLVNDRTFGKGQAA